MQTLNSGCSLSPSGYPAVFAVLPLLSVAYASWQIHLKFKLFFFLKTHLKPPLLKSYLPSSLQYIRFFASPILPYCRTISLESELLRLFFHSLLRKYHQRASSPNPVWNDPFKVTIKIIYWKIRWRDLQDINPWYFFILLVSETLLMGCYTITRWHQPSYTVVLRLYNFWLWAEGNNAKTGQCLQTLLGEGVL